MTRYFISIGNIIIDDIILPDGSSRMGTLGGGATHAVMGMRVWSEQVGLVTPVGADFGGDQLAALAERFDLHGLVVRPHDPTPRAWQLFETDGTRNEVFRTSYEGMAAMNPQPEDLPAFYEQLAAEGATEILSIHIAVKLSAVVEMAAQGAKETRTVPVTPLASGLHRNAAAAPTSAASRGTFKGLLAAT